MSTVLVSELIGFSLIALVVVLLAFMSNKRQKQFDDFDKKERDSEDKL